MIITVLGLTGANMLHADTHKAPTFWYMGKVNQHHNDSQKVGNGTATLISPQWALTAKHVAQFKLRNPNGGALEIVFGSGERAFVTNVYPAPGEDVALCRLNRRIDNIEKTALMSGCWAGSDGLVTFTHAGKSGGLHWKRGVKGRGSCHGFDIKNGNPGKAGDSGGFFGFERSACRNVQFSVIHGGGNGPQVGPLKSWITNTINTHGGDHPEWVTRDVVTGGTDETDHTWTGGGKNVNWNDYNNWSTCGKPGVNSSSNTSNSEIARLVYKSNSSREQPEPRLEKDWSIGTIVFLGTGHRDITVRNDAHWKLETGAARRRINLNGNNGQGIVVDSDANGSYTHDFQAGIRIVMENDLDWIINGNETLVMRGRLSGAGTLTKKSSGTLSFVGTDDEVTNNGSNALDIQQGVVLLDKKQNTSTIGGDILLSGPTATLRLNRNEQISESSTVTMQAGLFDLNSKIETIGALVMDGGAILPGTLAGTSGFEVRSGFAFADLDGSVGLNKTTPASVSLYGANTYSGPTTVTEGELRVVGSHQGAGSYTVNGAGTLSGTGSLDGHTTVDGTLAPGQGSIGTLTVKNNVQLNGIARMEINGDSLTADRVTGMAHLNYGGTLEIVLSAGTLEENDAFELFDAETYGGAFTNMILPTISTDLVWRTETLLDNGILSIGHPDKPFVSNRSGASGVSITNTTLNGALISTGAAATSVSVFWGPTDGGTIEAAWSNRVDFGPQPTGTLSTAIVSLQDETTYHYRYFAANAVGDSWASSTSSFITPSGRPELINIPATGLTSTSAVARAEVLREGVDGNLGFLLWDEVDQGDELTAWTHGLAVGPLTAGPVALEMTGLIPDTTYYYRFWATNDYGGHLASPSIAFTTTGLAPLDYDYRMQICFDGYDRPETLTNFPYLVVLDETLSGFDYETVSSDIAADLRFTTMSSTNVLPYEVEEWNTNGSSYVWVKVPALNSNECIFAYWGNPEKQIPPDYTHDGSTWSEDFAGVWHLHDESSVDSSAGEFHGADVGTASVAGQIGGARNWSGADSIELPPTAFAGISNEVTFSIWQFGDAPDQPKKDYLFYGSSPVGKEFAAKVPDENKAIEWDAFGNYDRISKTAVSANFEGQWNHWTFTKNSSLPRQQIYLNGDLFQSDTSLTNRYTAVTSFVLGAQDDDRFHYDGYLDEFRVSTVERSSNWIWAASQNMSGAGTLDTYLQVTGLKLPTIVLQGGVSNVTPTSAEMNSFLISTGVAPTEVSLFWGLSDGGFDPAAWDFSISLGLRAEGPIATVIPSLTPDQTYVYRYLATNSEGPHWTEVSAPFLTSATTLDPDRFAYHLPIGLDGYTREETLTNFPVLVVLDHAITNFDYRTFASTEAIDLRFTDADGITLLNYEIERWDPTGASTLWVQVPALSSNQTIHAYWGNPGAASIAAPYTEDGSTWMSDFRAVWHLGEDGGVRYDATTNAVTSSQVAGTLAGDAYGAAGWGMDFDGSNDFIKFANDGTLNMTNHVSYEAYMRWRGGGESLSRVVASAASGSYQQFEVSSTGVYRWRNKFGGANNLIESGITLNAGEWVHIGFAYDGTERRLYLNGEQVAAGADLGPMDSSATSSLYLGGQAANNNFDGSIDEVRVAAVGLSSNWMWASSLNLPNAPTPLAGYGAAEQLRVPTIITEAVTGLSLHSATLHGTLISTGAAPTSVRLYWGPEDGGSDPGAWANEVLFGTRSPGPLNHALIALPEDTDFFYRYVAENSEGKSESLTTGTFTTPYTSQLNPALYTHRVKINFDGYEWAEPLTNFPALVVLDEGVISNFFFDTLASESGGDLRFTDADGVTLLAYELEAWQPFTNTVAWVKVPVLTSNACVYAYWGNTGATNTPSYTLNGSTWSEDYQLVLHMNELDAADQIPDSTPGFYHGAHVGTDAVPGVIAGARSWNGEDYIQVPNAAVEPLAGAVTVTLWQYGDAAKQPQNDTLFRAANSSGVRELSVHLPWGNGDIYWDAGASSSSFDRLSKTSTVKADYEGRWNHWAFTKDMSIGRMRMRLNGSTYKSTSGYTRWMGGITSDLFIGSNVNGASNHYDGFIDEFRISNVVRTDCWIDAEHENAGDNANFQTVEPVDYYNRDMDNDGLTDTWERANFGSLAGTDGSTDGDHDGRTDREEFIADTDPTDIDSYLWVDVAPVDSTTQKIFFPTSFNRTYQIESSTDLILPFTPITFPIPGEGGLMSMDVPVPSADQRTYYRVSVSAP